MDSSCQLACLLKEDLAIGSLPQLLPLLPLSGWWVISAVLV